MVMQVAKTQAMLMPGGEWKILKITYLIKLYLIPGTTLKIFLHTFRLEFKAELAQQTLQIVQPPVCVIGYLSNASALCRSGETTAASLTGRAGELLSIPVHLDGLVLENARLRRAFSSFKWIVTCLQGAKEEG